MSEFEEVQRAMERAAADGDTITVQRLLPRYRRLQQENGTLPRVANFQPNTVEELNLARRAREAHERGDVRGRQRLTMQIAAMRAGRTIGRSRQGGQMSFVSGINHSLFNIGDYAVAGMGVLRDAVTGREDAPDFGTRLQGLHQGGESLRAERPVEAATGEVTGILATLPIGGGAANVVARGAARVAPNTVRSLQAVPRASQVGEAARAAEIARRGGRAGQVYRGTVRAAAPAAVAGTVYGAAEGGAREGTVEGAVEGARDGAAFGVVAAPVLRGGAEIVAPVVTPFINSLRENPGIRALAARLKEPVDEVVRRYIELRSRLGHNPTAAEVMGARGAREVGALVTAHGDAAERAIELSDAARAARPGQIASAISPRAPVSSTATNAQATQGFTRLMDEVGGEAVTLTPNDIARLNDPAIVSIMRDTKGGLQSAYREISEGAARLETASSTRATAQQAQRALREAETQLNEARTRIPTIASPRERVRAKQALPAQERQVARLREQANRAAAAARVAQQAAQQPVRITLRDIDSIRLGLNQLGQEGNRYAMFGLADRVRAIASSRGGDAGRRYEIGLRALAREKSRAEGIDAGRRVVASSGQAEAMAAASGVGQDAVQAAATQAGARQGVRSGIQEEVLKSPQASERVTNRLATDTGLQRGVTDVLGPSEGNRIVQLGRVTDEAAQTLEAATPARAATETQEMMKKMQQAIGAAVVASGRSGGAFQATQFQKFFESLQIRPNAARALANMMFDPEQAGRAVGILVRYAGDANRMRQIMERIVSMLPTSGQQAWNAAMGSEGVAPSTTEIPPRDPDTYLDEEPATGEELTHEQVSDDFLDRLAQAESGGDPDARASTSSAAGMYQFTEGTWLATLRDYGDSLGLGQVTKHINTDGTVSDTDRRSTILDLRFDPEIATLVASALTADNFNTLTNALGEEPSDGEMYAAHFLGVNDAIRLIKAVEDGETNAAALFPRAARTNRQVFYVNGRSRTAAELLEYCESLMESEA